MMTENAANLLREIARSKRYPVVRFELKSTKDRSLRSTALNHVRIQKADEGIEEIKERGTALKELEEEGMVVIDYALPVTLSADYAVYEQSKAFQLLKQTVEEGKSRPGFLFDQAVMRRGMVQLTSRGKKSIGL